MPPTLDVDHDSTTNSSKRHFQSGHSDSTSSLHSSNNSRYDMQQHKSHLNTIGSPLLHHQHPRNNPNDRYHQTLVTVLPSQLRAYDRSPSQTSDPHHLGHQHSHSFSHNNSFTPNNHNQHQLNHYPTSRFHQPEKNDLFYLQKPHQQLHNFSSSTSRRSHHNSKSRINDYIKISDCQSNAPQASNYLEASYMLTSPSSNHHSSHSNDRLQSKSTEYKQVDFIKTDALEDLRAKKADRERGRST